MLLLWTNNIFAQQYVIKLSYETAENTPKGQMANRFRELINERLGGRVVVEVYPNSQLFGDNKILEAMQLGDVQMAMPSISKFNRFSNKLHVFDIPFRFKDISDVEHFQKSKEGQELLESLTRSGLLGLGYLNYGMRQILSTDYLSPPSSPGQVFSKVNPKGEYNRGLIWSRIYSNFEKSNRSLDHITISNHNVLTYIVVTSTEFWNSLPNDIRGEVQSALKEALEFGNEVAHQKNERDKQKIIDSRRFETRELSDQERQEWINNMIPVFQKYERLSWGDKFCPVCTDGGSCPSGLKPCVVDSINTCCDDD
jgi:C4-dicarboxylate-binding protein DctP